VILREREREKEKKRKRKREREKEKEREEDVKGISTFLGSKRCYILPDACVGYGRFCMVCMVSNLSIEGYHA
jgi:hypothetical protein